MNKLAVITAFLGGVKNRYIQYHPDRSLAEKLSIAASVDGVDGVELCYPADFERIQETERLLSTNRLQVSGINVRSRRSGRWLRGAFSSSDPRERAEVVDDFRRAMDYARRLDVTRITTCPLNDGHDYVFEMNYLDAYDDAAECFRAICDHDPGIRICIEYKRNDPRVRCLFAGAGEVIAFADRVGAENLGATFDFGHSLLAGERPAMAASLLHQAGRLFYVHLNDNDRNWDWDMVPGAYNLLELIEFFFYLQEIGYNENWYAYDVMSKEVDTTKHFASVVHLTRRIEALTERLDRHTVLELMKDRDPSKTMTYLYDTLFPADTPSRESEG
jgi:xylose isomerase